MKLTALLHLGVQVGGCAVRVCVGGCAVRVCKWVGVQVGSGWVCRWEVGGCVVGGWMCTEGMCGRLGVCAGWAHGRV